MTAEAHGMVCRGWCGDLWAAETEWGWQPGGRGCSDRYPSVALASVLANREVSRRGVKRLGKVSEHPRHRTVELAVFPWKADPRPLPCGLGNEEDTGS